MSEETTKKCKCGCTDLILIRSQFLKLCPDCGAELPWELTGDQEMIK